jgi:hypothetical protein
LKKIYAAVFLFLSFFTVLLSLPYFSNQEYAKLSASLETDSIGFQIADIPDSVKVYDDLVRTLKEEDLQLLKVVRPYKEPITVYALHMDDPFVKDLKSTTAIFKQNRTKIEPLSRMNKQSIGGRYLIKYSSANKSQAKGIISK